MALTPPAGVTVEHAGFQETARLGESSRAGAQHSSRRIGNSWCRIRRVAKSDGARGDVDPANIVEGRGQKSEKEFARFLRISLNSTSELEYHLITARDFGVLTQSDFLALLSQTIEVRKMLHALINRLAAP